MSASNNEIVSYVMYTILVPHIVVFITVCSCCPPQFSRLLLPRAFRLPVRTPEPYSDCRTVKNRLPLRSKGLPFLIVYVKICLSICAVICVYMSPRGFQMICLSKCYFLNHSGQHTPPDGWTVTSISEFRIIFFPGIWTLK